MTAKLGIAAANASLRRAHHPSGPMQEFDAAKEQLLQSVLHFSTARTRRVSAAAAALETLAVLFIAQGDAPNAANCLDQSLAVSSILTQDRSMRQLNDVEVAKVYFLKSLLCERLGSPDQVSPAPAPALDILRQAVSILLLHACLPRRSGCRSWWARRRCRRGCFCVLAGSKQPSCGRCAGVLCRCKPILVAC